MTIEIKSARTEGEPLITSSMFSDEYYLLTKWKQHDEGLVEVFSEATRYNISKGVKHIIKKSQKAVFEEIFSKFNDNIDTDVELTNKGFKELIQYVKEQTQGDWD